MSNVYNMKHINYNLFMTLLKMLDDKLPSILSAYNMGNVTISVSPSYPRDMSKLCKPSIIIRKVDISQSKIAMGNFIGQSFSSIDGYKDVYGMNYDAIYQLDILANGNEEVELFSDMIVDDIFNDIIINNSAKFPLYDFVGDINNPVEVGVVAVAESLGVVNLKDGTEPNINNDYVRALRQSFNIIQTIIPQQGTVDLSKWIKQTFTINNQGGK